MTTSRMLGAGLVATLLAVGTAQAQEEEDCTEDFRRGALEVSPVTGPLDSDGDPIFPATLNAPVKVRYSVGYFEDPSIGAIPEESFSLWEVETGTPVPGAISVEPIGAGPAQGDWLVFTPDVPYLPRTEYMGMAAGVDISQDVNFWTGVSPDVRPPMLSRIESMTAQPVAPSCDAPDGGYRVDVRFEPASDDGPPGDIEYLLYLSRGPEVNAPQLRARIRNQSPSQVTMAFVIDPAEAVSPICLTVHAVDGVGNVDDDTPPFCDDPIKGNFFAPLCAVTAPGASDSRGAGGAAAVLGVLWVLVLLRRRSA